MPDNFSEFLRTLLVSFALVAGLSAFDAAMWNGPPVDWAGGAML